MKFTAVSSAAAVATLTLLLAITACSSPQIGTPTPQAVGPESSTPQQRSRELPLDGLDPCSLLTPAQEDALRINRGREYAPGDPAGHRVCQWLNGTETQDTYQIALVTDFSISDVIYSYHASPISSIAGFAAVQSPNPVSSPDTSCVIFIDIARGQVLQFDYDYEGSSASMDHRTACAKASAGAELAVATLKDLHH